jgi:hypothetical protein
VVLLEVFNTTTSFSRRRPDVLTEELVVVLSGQVAFEFKALFEIVHVKLRARNVAGGGEEMLRLRAYEKLQNMVYGGSVKKVAKKYSGIAPALAALSLQLQSRGVSAAPSPACSESAALAV